MTLSSTIYKHPYNSNFTLTVLLQLAAKFKRDQEAIALAFRDRAASQPAPVLDFSAMVLRGFVRN